jgi:hypothetical protein
MTTRLETASLYSRELLGVFPTLEHQVAEFLGKYTGMVATPETPANLIMEYSTALSKIGQTIAEGIKSGRLTENELFKAAITPARTAGKFDRVTPGKVGIVVHGGGKHRYHVLDKEQGPTSSGRDLLFLLQRLPKGVDTQPEVHTIGGIEIYLPLVDGITFYINREVYQLEALSALLIVLPGDVHHHVKNEGQGPARVLIIGGFGFGVGDKVPPEEVEETIDKAGHQDIPRLIKLD